MNSGPASTSAPVEPIVIRFHGDMWDVRPRRLWQRLFDFYREQGCPLDHMDNMLIDLRNCIEAMDATHEAASVRFMWGCDPGHYRTTWINEQVWVDTGIELCVAISSFEWFVLCELTADEATFTII